MNKPANIVLLVDDEPKIRRFLRAGFELNGYYVIEAENAADALKAATLNSPDLIVLDLALPDLHGTDVLAQLSQLDLVFSNFRCLVEAKAESLQGAGHRKSL